jgi:hypothetical protein
MFEAKGIKGAAQRLQLLVGDAREPFPAAAKEAKVRKENGCNGWLLYVPITQSTLQYLIATAVITHCVSCHLPHSDFLHFWVTCSPAYTHTCFQHDEHQASLHLLALKPTY